jgi:hypothetical protein
MTYRFIHPEDGNFKFPESSVNLRSSTQPNQASRSDASDAIYNSLKTRNYKFYEKWLIVIRPTLHYMTFLNTSTYQFYYCLHALPCIFFGVMYI